MFMLHGSVEFKRRKRAGFSAIAVVLSLSLLAGCASVVRDPRLPPSPTAATGTISGGEGFTLVAENDYQTLWLNTAECVFEVRDANGNVFSSRPANWDNSDYVADTIRPVVASMLVLNVLDLDYAAARIDSYSSCVKEGAKGSVSYESIPGGFRAVFNFAEFKITVPLDITLTADGFSATVESGGVIAGPIIDPDNSDAATSAEDVNTYTVNQIGILPYFNSGSKFDQGFLFIPDGSGIIARYDDNFGNAREVTRTVYGVDRGLNTVETEYPANGYRMPVFGGVTNNTGYLAEITSGDYMANIVTGTAMLTNSFFHNNAMFIFRDVGQVPLRDNETQVNSYYTVPSDITISEDMRVDYYLITGGSIDYSDLAWMYREVLKERGVLTKQDDSGNIGLHLTVFGATDKADSVAGIPLDIKQRLTTYEQSAEMIKKLQGVFGNVSAIMMNDSEEHFAEFAPDGALGGADALKTMIADAESLGNRVYLNGSMLQVYEGERGFSASRQAGRNIGDGISYQYFYNLIDGTADKVGVRRYLLTPRELLSAAKRYISTATPYSTRYAFTDLGGLIYSDYNRSAQIYRDEAGVLFEEALKQLDDGGSMALGVGNAYTWQFVDELYDVPLSGSSLQITSENVPFYQMVIHGYITYSGSAVNLQGSRERWLLRSLEYGAIPHYYGIAAPSSATSQTGLDKYFAMSVEDWFEDAAQFEQNVRHIYDDISGQEMIGHEKISSGVYKTYYTNSAVTVNYNDMTFSYEAN
jgi:hypothetical protein